MQTGWTIAAAVAALGIGFGAGMATAPTSSGSGSSGTEVFGNAITFLGAPPVEASSGDPLRAALGLVSYPSYSEARERLAELWGELDRPGRGAIRATLDQERLLDELEQILALAGEEELVEFIAERPFSRGTVAVAEIAYAALATLSPERAAELWVAESDETTAYPALKVVLGKWLPRDPAAARRWVDRLPPGEQAETAQELSLILSAKFFPDEVVAKLEGITSLPPGAALYLGETLPLEELAAVAERLLAAQGEEGRFTEALSRLLLSWSDRDPLAAVSWFLARDLGGFGDGQVVEALGRAALREPWEMLQLLGPQLPDRSELGLLAGIAWWTWAAQEGNETASVEWIVRHAEEAARFLGSPFLGIYRNSGDWPPERIDGILAALGNQEPSPGLDLIAQSLIGQLSGYQPEVALRHAVELLPPGRETNEIMGRAVVNWSIKEPEAALRWGLDHIEGQTGRYSAVKFSVTHWARRDASGAAAFAMGLEEDDRRAALSGLGESWGRDDADAALAFLAETAEPDAMAPFAEGAFRAFGQNRSAELFFERAMELPEGRLRNRALDGLFRGWAGRDPDAATSVIAGIPAGEMRDAAILGAIGNLSGWDPGAATDLATRISDPERRQREVIWLARAWMKASPEAAEAAIRANPSISEAAKTEIFKESAP